MRKIFSFYRRFLGTIFVLWLFLSTAGKLGFGFGVNLRLFFRVFFWFILVYLVWETINNRATIYSAIKGLFLKVKNEFNLRTETTQKNILSSLPKVLTGKGGRFLVLILAVVVSSFSFLLSFIKILKRFIFHRVILLLFFIFGVFANIFILSFTSDLIILLLIGSLILNIYRYKLKGEFSAAVGFISLTACPFLLIFKKELIAEKVAIWVYVFLAVGIIQILVKYIKEEKKSVPK